MNQLQSICVKKCKNQETQIIQNPSCQNLKNENSTNSDEFLKPSQKQQAENCFESVIKQNCLQDFQRRPLKKSLPNKQIDHERSLDESRSREFQKQKLKKIERNQTSIIKQELFLNKSNTQGPNELEKQNYNLQEQYNGQEIHKNQNYSKLISKNQICSIFKQPSICEPELFEKLKKQNLSMFYSDLQIFYPIPDYIFKNSQNLPLQSDCLRSVKTHILPKGFNFLLEILNVSYLFPDVFKFDQETIIKILQSIQTPLQQKINKQHLLTLDKRLNCLLQEYFKQFLNTFVFLMINDLTNQKLQTITEPKTYNILSLAKFCQQNELLEFVFKYNWCLIILQLTKLSCDQSNLENSQYKKSIQFIQNNILNQKYQFPEHFQLKFEILSLLIDSYSRTNSFRELFNKKIESNRNVSKKKTELQQQKKNIQQIIKKINTTKAKKTKKIVKIDKKKNKQISIESEHESQKNQSQNCYEQLQKLQRQLSILNYEIQKENRQDSLSCSHFLGKDESNYLYWYISYFPDKLFVQKNDSDWQFYSIDQMIYFHENLNRKGINQNKLYGKIQEYYRNFIYRYQCKMEIETNQYNAQSKEKGFQTISIINEINISKQTQNVEIDIQNEELQENQNQVSSSKNSIQNQDLLICLGAFKMDKDSLFKMIQIGERKMTQYLKQRNSRWGSEQCKQLLFSTIKGSHQKWLEQVKKQLSIFNQKICVVQIQYKVYVQQSAEQVDSKIKKIQTKIWGINQKYKHNWYDFINSCSNFTELFFAVSVLYSLIKKYASKHRKLRKQYEQIKQKTTWIKTQGGRQWKQSWNQICQVCGLSGEVLCCDYCPKVYHLVCINLTEIPQSQYKCNACKQQITTRNQLKTFANDAKRQNKK